MSEIISIFANGSKIKCSKKNLGSFIKMSRQINGIVEITEDSCNGSNFNVISFNEIKDNEPNINFKFDTKWYFKDVNINGVPIKDGMEITFTEFAPK
jgi:hypothetical protein